MENRFDRAYYEERLSRSLELAAQATIPSIRELHHRHAMFYEYVLLGDIKSGVRALDGADGSFRINEGDEARQLHAAA